MSSSKLSITRSVYPAMTVARLNQMTVDSFHRYCAIPRPAGHADWDVLMQSDHPLPAGLLLRTARTFRPRQEENPTVLLGVTRKPGNEAEGALALGYLLIRSQVDSGWKNAESGHLMSISSLRRSPILPAWAIREYIWASANHFNVPWAANFFANRLTLERSHAYAMRNALPLGKMPLTFPAVPLAVQAQSLRHVPSDRYLDRGKPVADPARTELTRLVVEQFEQIRPDMAGFPEDMTVALASKLEVPASWYEPVPHAVRQAIKKGRRGLI